MLRRIAVALFPLALTPGIVWLLAEGHLNLGGGEKDILIAIPWLLWSVVFAIATMVRTRGERSFGRGIGTAALWASAILVTLWLALLFASSGWLGVR